MKNTAIGFYVDEPEEGIDLEMATKTKLKPTLDDGYFICPVLGLCNMRKALKERAEAIRREYEAFDNMHRADGTFVSKRHSSL